MVGYQVYCRKRRRIQRRRKVVRFPKRLIQRKREYEHDRMEAQSPRKLQRTYELAERWWMEREEREARERARPQYTEEELEALIE